MVIRGEKLTVASLPRFWRSAQETVPAGKRGEEWSRWRYQRLAVLEVLAQGPSLMNALIVDDERLAREELKTLLEAHPRISVVGEACSEAKAQVAGKMRASTARP